MENGEFDVHRFKVEKALGYQFKNIELLKLAMIHRSYWNEHRHKVSGHNERLEFLGDAVLSLCVAHQLYQQNPQLTEGQLTQMRSQVVDSTACFLYCQNMGISECILVGKGEKYNRGRGYETIVGDFFEALIGAIYLDGGLDAALKCFTILFEFEIQKGQDNPSHNWKSQLQDFSQKQLHAAPVYQTLEETGPEHAKEFKVAVLINNEVIGEGRGFSKKEAQVAAAKQGLARLIEKHPLQS